MGVLSDLVVADESQIAAILAADAQSASFRRADVKGIDTIKVATLESILTGRPYKELEDHEPVASESEDGPWLFSMRPSLVETLANTTDDRCMEVATAWAATEEFRVEGWPLESVRIVLAEFRRLSRIAVAERKRLFLWMSL